MPNEIAPLLPPNPDKPGWWWLRTKDARIFGAQWSPAAGCWTFGSERKGRSPSSLASYGYTLATRHRILTPGELEAVHALPDRFKREARAGAEGVQADYRMIAICTAQADADMLRAALGDTP